MATQLLFPSLGDTAANSSAGNVTTTGNTTGSKSESGTSTSNTNGTSTVDGVNMGPEAMAALNKLIAQLLGGGTQQMAKDEAARKGEINAVQAQRAGYSKDAAFGDAQGLIAQTMRQALEQSIPTISRAAEGAGTSGNALQALLAQDASARAAESASVAGLGAATQYGNISTNLSGILESLTRPNNSVVDSLLSALNVAKGSVNKSTTTGSETKTTVGTGSSNSTGSTSENKSVGSSGTYNNQPSANVQYFGPTNPDAGKLPDEYLYSALYQLNKDNFTNNLTF